MNSFEIFSLIFLLSIIYVQCDEQAQCSYKGKKIGFVFIHSFLVSSPSGTICGDKCSSYDKYCNCGDSQLHFGDGYYCCIHPNQTCKVESQSKVPNCADGRPIPWKTFCQSQN